jgi:hypothetical protein
MDLPPLDPGHTRQLIIDFYTFNAIGQAAVQQSDQNITALSKAILEEWLDDKALYALTHILNCSFTVYHVIHHKTICDGISISKISASNQTPHHHINLFLYNSTHYDGLLAREGPRPSSPILTACPNLPKSILQESKKRKLTDHFLPTPKPSHDPCDKTKTPQPKTTSRSKTILPHSQHTQITGIKRKLLHDNTPEPHATLKQLSHTAHQLTYCTPSIISAETPLPNSNHLCPASSNTSTNSQCPQGSPHMLHSRKRVRDVNPHTSGGVT